MRTWCVRINIHFLFNPPTIFFIPKYLFKLLTFIFSKLNNFLTKATSVTIITKQIHMIFITSWTFFMGRTYLIFVYCFNTTKFTFWETVFAKWYLRVWFLMNLLSTFFTILIRLTLWTSVKPMFNNFITYRSVITFPIAWRTATTPILTRTTTTFNCFLFYIKIKGLCTIFTDICFHLLWHIWLYFLY